MAIEYHRNRENIGIPRNFLKVVDMAEGEFAWLIGDEVYLDNTLEHPDNVIR